jgi:hypothetical protein
MKYICKKFKHLGFYVDGELKRFTDGEYNTAAKKEITVLDSLADVTKADEVTSK